MNCATAQARSFWKISADSRKVMPFAGFVFGLAAFAAIGLPGFANFAGEVIDFLRRVRHGADMHARSTHFRSHRPRALGRGDFRRLHVARVSRCLHGTIVESSGVVLLICATRCGCRSPCSLPPCFAVGFFPQSFVQIVTPPFRSFFAAK